MTDSQNREPEIYISFASAVNPQTAQVLMGALTNAVNKGCAKIHLLLSTPGGTTAEGITLYNFIRALPVPVFIYNMGRVDSIGNVMFQAGTRRIASTTSSFMFHGVGFDITNARMEYVHLIEKIKAVQNDQSIISAIMAERTGLASTEVDSLFQKTAFVNASEAVQRGIADEVSNINLPQGVPIQQLIFN